MKPSEVWDEMAWRERLFGIAEKVPKKMLESAANRHKVVVLHSRRSPKRR